MNDLLDYRPKYFCCNCKWYSSLNERGNKDRALCTRPELLVVDCVVGSTQLSHCLQNREMSRCIPCDNTRGYYEEKQ